MSTALAITPVGKSQVGRSVLAVTAALVANAALSLASDQLLHTLGVHPPWGEPMHEPEVNLLALSYRAVLGVVAGYLVARMAPSAPVRHATILGLIAVALSAIGAVVGITHPEIGPAWYPILLAIVAYPTVRLGAALHERRG